MSKKLLNESTVRRFMGLANLAPLSESFLETQVNEEEEINEETETVEEAAEATNEEAEAVTEGEEAIEEGGAAARVGNEGHDVGKGRMTADRIHEDETVEEEVKAEGLAHIQEDELEDEEEAAADMGAEVAMDAEVDLGAEEEAAAEGGDDLAARAEAILADLADLLTQAGIETTVTSDEEEAAVDDMADAGDDMMDAADDMEDAEEDLMQETTTGEKDEDGAEAYGTPQKGQKLTTSSPGRGNKKGDEADVNEVSSVDALVAEITSKVISRLNK
jgi:hypothetical protein